MTKNNPFPGMNPFLERHWSDVHTSLIGYIRDSLAEDLPPDLNARSEECVSLLDADGGRIGLRADVAVIESWKAGIPPQWEPGIRSEGGIVATEPQLVVLEEETERWIEISDKNGQLITVIEVLSPSNKGSGILAYRARRDVYLRGGVNLVEIDLLRGGHHSLAVPLEDVRKPSGAYYLTCVTRSTNAFCREVYATSLREPLPNVRIPLRPGEPDLVLVLQPLVDRCYRMGGYWNADQTNLPDPPLSEDESAWVVGQVHAAGVSE